MLSCVCVFPSLPPQGIKYCEVFKQMHARYEQNQDRVASGNGGGGHSQQDSEAARAAHDAEMLARQRAAAAAEQRRRRELGCGLAAAPWLLAAVHGCWLAALLPMLSCLAVRAVLVSSTAACVQPSPQHQAAFSVPQLPLLPVLSGYLCPPIHSAPSTLHPHSHLTSPLCSPPPPPPTHPHTHRW